MSLPATQTTGSSSGLGAAATHISGWRAFHDSKFWLVWLEHAIYLALLVLVEVIWGLAANGVAAVFLWAFAAETMLQLGYLAGIYARSVVARSDLAFPTTNGTSGPSR